MTRGIILLGKRLDIDTMVTQLAIAQMVIAIKGASYVKATAVQFKAQFGN